MVGAEKPARQIFDIALASAGLTAAGEAPPADDGAAAAAPGSLPLAVHVGDRRDTDVDGARAAGWEAIWLADDVQALLDQRERGDFELVAKCGLRSILDIWDLDDDVRVYKTTRDRSVFLDPEG